MLIDGFTLVAQIVNFLVLVWLLKRFLYKPILDAIDQREAYIARQIEEAENRKIQADRELAEYQKLNEEFSLQRQKLFNQAVTEVDGERIRLLDELHQEITSLRSDYLETLRSEQQSFGEEITLRTQTQVFEIARKTLHDLASVNLEDQIANAFLARLDAISEEYRQQMVAWQTSTRTPIYIRSSFTLSQPLQNKIIEKIRTLFNVDATIHFETEPGLISGIALIFGGLKVIWSINEYLNDLKNDLSELIKEKYRENA